ncbi:MAG: hypothetical protein GY780_15480 [bacterium]|nr:hypothetical protein [bacterium]
MRDGMSIIKSYTNETEAQIALEYLKALDITAVIEADNCGGMRPHMDLTCGVHLLVAGLDCEKAAAVLKESPEQSDAQPWTCAGCGENIEAGFDACWKCGNKHLGKQ